MSGLESTEKDSLNPFHLELEPEEDGQAKAADCPTTQNIHAPKQRPPSPSVANLDTKAPTTCSSKTLSHGISPKLKQKLLGLFKKDVDKSDEVERPEREQVATPEQEEDSDILCVQSDAEKTLDKAASAKKKDQISSTPEVRTVQLLALQKTPFKETMTSTDVGMDVQVPESVSDLRAFWEKESTASQTNDDTAQSNAASVEAVASRDPTTACNVEIMTNSGSNLQEITAEGPPDPSHGDWSLSIPLSEEDGTYRANPVIIFEETDESLTGSLTETQSYEPQEVICSLPSQVGLQTTAQEEIAVSSPFTFGEDSPVKISQCDETAMSGTTVPLRVKEDSPISKVISAETDRRGDTDHSEVEGQMSPRKTKSYVILKTSRMSSKGLVSPDGSPLRSSSGPGDMQPTHFQSSTLTDSQERPVSPRKSATLRPREQGDEVRRSPSKTCHPKALPREASGPNTSSLEGSPLKTFPINIEPQIKSAGEDHMKPTPVPRQRKSPSLDVKQKNHADNQRSTDFPSSDPPSYPEDRGTFFDPNRSSSSTSPQSKRALPISPTRLARSYVPQDYEHYLGPQEKAYIPHFYAEKGSTAESDVGHRNQADSSTVSWVGKYQDKTTRACSLSRASLSSELLIFFLSALTLIQDH